MTATQQKPREPAEAAVALQEAALYLASPAAFESIARDPYWPKWVSPFWQMLALWEAGRADLIPQPTALAYAHAANKHYLQFFPLRLEDIPAGVDPQRGTPCHCQLGNLYQVLTAAGVDIVDREIPWLRPWFLKYQLPDGGLNCDEAHYTREKPCSSSITSTLPCLEAILRAAPRPLSAEELAFLDRGAEYLMRHRLYLRKSTGEPMDAAFTEFIFPRFYAYDILRGLSFLVDWAAFRGVEIPAPLSPCPRCPERSASPPAVSTSPAASARRTTTSSRKPMAPPRAAPHVFPADGIHDGGRRPV